MKKVVVNKNFNKYYLNKYIERIMDFNGTTRENDYSYKYGYNDIISGTTSSYGTISKYMVVNSYGLDIIEKTQNFVALDTDASTLKTDGKENLLYSLITTNKNINTNSIYQFMVNRGLITEETKNKAFISTIDTLFDSIVPVYKNYKYIEDDVVTFRSNNGDNLNSRVFKLTKQASIGAEDLFLVVFMLETPRFSEFKKYINVGVDDVVKYPFINFDGRQRISYLAFELGTPSNPKDINYDNLDKITHLDSIELKIALPKEIIMKY